MDFVLNGKKVFAANGGRQFDPSLPTVVLIHGAGFDHSAWALHSRYFAHHGHSVLVPDLPGHGRSAGPALRTIAEMADWIAALLDAARAQKAHLIGHSMGSVIALETAELGITCNAICPGYVSTPLVEAQIDGQAKAHGKKREQPGVLRRLSSSLKAAVSSFGRLPSSTDQEQKDRLLKQVREIVKVSQDPVSLETPIGEESERAVSRRVVRGGVVRSEGELHALATTEVKPEAK